MTSKAFALVCALWLSASLARAEESPSAAAPDSSAAGHESAEKMADGVPGNSDAPATAEGSTLAANTLIEHTPISHNATAKEITSLLRLGHNHFKSGDFDSAILAFMQVLAEHGMPEETNDALLSLARTYRKKGDFTKSAAVYERFAKEFPADPSLPSVYLELGRTFRALGAYKQAIAQFYSVLNSTLKLPDQSADDYRQLARTAQFEIAETYFQTGDYNQASRFFSRLNLLDLAPEDRARAQFKAAFSLALAMDDEKAVSALQAYTAQNPNDENIPEARYLLSISLRRLGRTQESLRVTLDLLKVENSRTKKDERRWSYWQRKTGNQLANEFYQTGDFSSALSIYQSLAELSTEVAWNLPVTYQTGLCYERLRVFDRARNAYQSIVDRLKNTGSDASIPRDLVDLGQMAAWRLSQLNWQLTTDAQLSNLFPSEPHQFEKAATPTASVHDIHGSPPIASDTVR